MARIKLKNGDVFEVDQQWAEALNKSWSDRTLSGTTPLEIIPGKYELKNQIVAIEIGGTRNTGSLDINDPQVREMIKTVERELEAIVAEDPEKRTFAFEWWCANKGYFVYVTEERKHYDGSLGGEARWYKRPIVGKARNDADMAFAIKEALSQLRGRRYYAQKQEHISQLGITGATKCPQDTQCVFCYPAPFKRPRNIFPTVDIPH